MKVFITGGTGFVGRCLSHLLLNKGHQVIATGTRPAPAGIRSEKFHYIRADTTQKGDWQASLKNMDAVVNLAGRSVFSFWTKRYKKLIYDSRILTTRNLVESLPENKDIIFCSTSATGYYGNRGDDILTEDDPGGNDFLAEVCRDWEAEAFRAEKKGIRVVAMRLGVVLGKDGGAMRKMVPAFRFFMGGPLGDGMQWFPWIHLDDLSDAILFILENPDVRGPVHLISPDSVRNRDFARILGQVLKRPAFMPSPAFMVRLLLGEFGASVLSSQRAVPDKLSGCGFCFRYPDLEKALRNIIMVS